MTLELSIRYAEVILSIAIFQQSLEFLHAGTQEKWLGIVRMVLVVFLLLGLQPLLVESLLLLTSICLLVRFQGPYNGGSDTMTFLVLLCLWCSHLAPTMYWQEIAIAYLAVQLILSYFQSGWVKVVNPEWRSGRALYNVFALTAYPVSESVRRFAQKPGLLLVMSWLVIIFELLFPLVLFNQLLLYVGLFVAVLFHLANACLFGLNRFFWIWPAAYPIIIWFQIRVTGLF
jgi:hypothetical protein